MMGLKELLVAFGFMMIFESLSITLNGGHGVSIPAQMAGHADDLAPPLEAGTVASAAGA